jgi:hypothetical protein
LGHSEHINRKEHRDRKEQFGFQRPFWLALRLRRPILYLFPLEPRKWWADVTGDGPDILVNPF